ncbi:DUF4412 domain-containing protein [bacterium]|nr:DUF4412 domain-containing protein [bacterium]
MRPSALRLPVILLLILCGRVFSGDGFYLEEEVTTPPLFGLPEKTHRTRTWITKTRLRRDEGDKEQSMIIDTDRQKAWILTHRDSTVMEMGTAAFQGLAMMTMMMFGVTYDTLTGAPVIPDSIFYRTGRTGRVNGWPCEEVIVQRRHRTSASRKGSPVIMWMTSGTPVYAQILRALMGPLAEQYAPFFRQMENLGGYPASLNTRAMGMDISQKLLKMERIDIPASLFDLPADYSRVKSD